MAEETKARLGTVFGIAAVLGVFCFTGSACQQNADKLETERFHACVNAGGSWDARGKGSASCLAKLP